MVCVCVGGSYVLHTRSEAHNEYEPYAYYTVAALENAQVNIFRPRSVGGYEFSATISLSKGDAYCVASARDVGFNGYKMVTNDRVFITSG